MHAPQESLRVPQTSTHRKQKILYRASSPMYIRLSCLAGFSHVYIWLNRGPDSPSPTKNLQSVAEGPAPLNAAHSLNQCRRK